MPNGSMVTAELKVELVEYLLNGKWVVLPPRHVLPVNATSLFSSLAGQPYYEPYYNVTVVRGEDVMDEILGVIRQAEVNISGDELILAFIGLIGTKPATYRVFLVVRLTCHHLRA